MPVNYKMLKEFRRLLHANPELSGKEKQTSELIFEFLKANDPDEILTGVGGYGIIAIWDSGMNGKEIMFRSELDALPIEEINDFEYSSKIKGFRINAGMMDTAQFFADLPSIFQETDRLREK